MIRHFLFLFLGLFMAFPAPAAAQSLFGNKQAVIFMDPDVTSHERWFQDFRVEDEQAYYARLGYKVQVVTAPTKDELVAQIFDALLDPKVTAMSFFGHGFGPDAYGATSTVLYENAQFWDRGKFTTLRKELAATTSLTGPELTKAARRAAEEARFDIMRNHSCSSLIDTRIAYSFVKPGGSYFGVRGAYATCATPAALIWDIDWELEEFVIPHITNALGQRLVQPGGPCTPEGWPGPVSDCRYMDQLDEPCIPCPNGFNYHYLESMYE